jgi:hypothetical protein
LVNGKAVTMTTDTTETLVPEVEELDRDAGRALLDEAARHYLGVSGDEFMSAWDAGKYDSDPDRPEVMRVAMLLPFGR